MQRHGTTRSVVKALDRLERKLGVAAVPQDLPRTHVYYCHPYSAFERGSNENANTLIRRWLPKGTKLSAVSKAQIKRIESWMNNYPRAILGGRCSNNVLAEWAAAEGVQLSTAHI